MTKKLFQVKIQEKHCKMAATVSRDEEWVQKWQVLWWCRKKEAQKEHQLSKCR